MGPHGICMRFVFRNMLTLSLSLSIGVAEATPRRRSSVPFPGTIRRFSPGENCRVSTSFFHSTRGRLCDARSVSRFFVPLSSFTEAAGIHARTYSKEIDEFRTLLALSICKLKSI